MIDRKERECESCEQEYSYSICLSTYLKLKIITKDVNMYSAQTLQAEPNMKNFTQEEFIKSDEIYRINIRSLQSKTFPV